MSQRAVLFGVTSLDQGGIESYLLRFIRHTKGLIKPTILCKSGRTGCLEEEYITAGADILSLRLTAVPSPNYMQLHRTLKARRFDAVCDFTGDFAGPVLAVSKAAGVPRRIAFYRGSSVQFRPTAARVLYAAALNQLTKYSATQILANSEAGLNYFHAGWQQSRGEYLIVRNGIPEIPRLLTSHTLAKRHELGIPAQANVVGHVGRFCAAKNFDTILTCFERLLSVRADVVVLLCGRGVPAGVKKSLSNSPHRGRYFVYDSRADGIEILQCLSALYFPSISEGMPNVLAEAMLSNIPFVASDIPSIKEICPPAARRFLVPPMDHVAATNVICELLDSPSHFPLCDTMSWAKREFSAEARFGEFLRCL